VDGTIVGVVLVIQDMTEHEQIQQDMEVRLQKLISLGIEIEQATRQ
jgi:signal transduction histidine kinase